MHKSGNIYEMGAWGTVIPEGVKVVSIPLTTQHLLKEDETLLPMLSFIGTLRSGTARAPDAVVLAVQLYAL